MFTTLKDTTMRNRVKAVIAVTAMLFAAGPLVAGAAHADTVAAAGPMRIVVQNTGKCLAAHGIGETIYTDAVCNPANPAVNWYPVAVEPNDDPDLYMFKNAAGGCLSTGNFWSNPGDPPHSVLAKLDNCNTGWTWIDSGPPVPGPNEITAFQTYSLNAYLSAVPTDNGSGRQIATTTDDYTYQTYMNFSFDSTGWATPPPTSGPTTLSPELSGDNCAQPISGDDQPGYVDVVLQTCDYQNADHNEDYQQWINVPSAQPGYYQIQNRVDGGRWCLGEERGEVELLLCDVTDPADQWQITMQYNETDMLISRSTGLALTAPDLNPGGAVTLTDPNAPTTGTRSWVTD